MSLLEAESLRAIIHLRRGIPLVPGTGAAVALRVGHVVLDASAGYKEGGEYQTTTAIQCYRFMDGEIDFEKTESQLVLRSLQVTSVDRDDCLYLLIFASPI